MRNVMVSGGLLIVMVLMALAVHSLLARVCKAFMASARPLASGEHEAVGYERRVYHTADAEMRRIVALVLCSGAMAWLAVTTGYKIIWLPAVAGIAAAVVLDLKWWERVTASASWVWMRRGAGSVGQHAIADIVELAVDEEDAPGLTLRNLVPGRTNAVCRLRLLMDDKRVITLPATDAVRGLADVEAVANHVRLRQQQAADQQSLQRAGESATRAAREAAAASSDADKELALELRRLRSGALSPDLPAAVRRDVRG